jgi:hypothetical protein
MLHTTTATIADTGTTSGVVRNVQGDIRSVFIPASFTGTALSFTASSTYGGTYVAVEDAAGAAVALVVESSKGYAIPQSVRDFPFVKFVVSAQTGAKTLTVVRDNGR